MKRLVVTAGAFLFVALLCVRVEAGTLLIFKESPSENSPASRMYVGDNALRMEEATDSEVMIFRRDKNVVWTIDPAQKTFTEMTPEGVAQQMSEAKRMMQEQMKQFQEELKQLPPEQRKMLESMGGGAFSQGKGAPESEMTKSSPLNWKKVASDLRFKRWRADKYELLVGGQKTEEVWVVDPRALGLTDKETQTVKAFFAFMGQLAKGSLLGDAAKTEFNTPTGAPVKTVTYEKGKPKETSELTEVRKEKFPSSLFEIPQGFRKVNPLSGQ